MVIVLFIEYPGTEVLDYVPSLVRGNWPGPIWSDSAECYVPCWVSLTALSG